MYVRCGMAVLFTCTLVLDCPASEEGWAWNLSRWSKQQDTGWTKTNKKNDHETEQQKPQFNHGLRPWRIYSRGAPRRWQVCTELWSHIYAVGRKCHELLATRRLWLIMIIPWFANQASKTDLCLFFCTLKINHDSHEFILEFGTVANSYIYAHILGLSMQRYRDC